MEVKEAAEHFEKWRFRRVEALFGLVGPLSPVTGQLTDVGPIIDTGSACAPKRRPIFLMDIADATPQLSDDLVEPDRWIEVVRGAWSADSL